ncbi:MAG TPA: D-alanyl-D-alanine carboxypeptidase, partial [Nannocystis sp.]
MARPLPQIASFLLALIAAYAGLATAGPVAPGELPALSAAFPVEAVPSDRPTATAAPAPELVDWPAEIAGRLAALREPPERRGHPRPADAAPPDDPTLAALHQLQQRLAAVVRRTGGARIGVHVRDLDSGRTLFDHHGNERYNPASNQKLVTAIAAVELLGPGYRFRTRVLRRDDTLVLVGEGDPSLQLTDLHALASEVIAAGAHRGIRRIVVDDSAFSPERHGPGYSPQGDGASYTAPSGALSLAFNTAVVTIRPTTPGEPASIDLSPPSAHLRLQGEVRTGRGRPLRVASRDADDLTVIEVDGALPAGHAPVTIRRRIADPGLFTGHAFADVLRQLAEAQDQESIALPVLREPAGPNAREVATH